MTSTEFAAMTDVVILSRRPELKTFPCHLTSVKWQLSTTRGYEWIPRKQR